MAPGRYREASRLLDVALRAALKLRSHVSVEWRSPLRRNGFKEYRDSKALSLLGIRALPKRSLSDFWPARGPVWDALGTTSDGQFIFVEAKANIPEAASPGSKANVASLTKIQRSLAEARRYYAPRATADWSRTFYQYANRLAHHYLIGRVNGLQSHLVFLYFTNAPDVEPASEMEWRGAIRLLHAALGIRSAGPGDGVHNLFLDAAPLADAAV